MAKKPLPSPEVLRQLLRYEPETGKLFWKERGPEWFSSEPHGLQWNARYAGKEAFTAASGDSGRRIGSIFNRRYLAHRVAWAMAYGEWVPLVDHKDGDPSNNRLKNLRKADSLQNCLNRCANRNAGYSKYKGVFLDVRDGVWFAQGVIKGERFYLGRHPDEISAARAYDEWAVKHHGEFIRLNLPGRIENDDIR